MLIETLPRPWQVLTEIAEISIAQGKAPIKAGGIFDPYMNCGII